MNIHTWTNDSGKFAHKRSPQLRAVDQAITTYAGVQNKINLYALTDAFLDWYESKPNWLASMRKSHMIDLVNYIKQQAATIVPGTGGYIFNKRMAKRKMAEMLAAPVEFLQNNTISIAGGPDSANLEFRATVDCGDLLFANDQLTLGSFHFPIRSYKIAYGGAAYGSKVMSACIKMHQDFSPQGTALQLQQKLFPVNAGQMVMTGTLTACSFVIQTMPVLSCTHIQPVGQVGEPLQDQIDGFGMPSTSVYGKRDYGALYTHIIGFSQGGWKIYSQRSNLNGQVVTLDQIYP